jgi:hypothetical protein
VKRKPGLFNGYWLDRDGRKAGRVRRSEYGELYRLHALGKRLGLQVENKR